MAAFNYIDIVGTCPNCGETSKISFQTHIASDFDGDEERFMNEHYAMGERMRWFGRTHVDFESWKTLGTCDCGGVHELCHGVCTRCKANLFTRIDFEALTPIKSSAWRPLEDWPRDPKNPGMRYSETVCDAHPSEVSGATKFSDTNEQ